MPTESEPRAVAEQIAASLTQAWNSYSGEAFGRAFTDDADFVNIFGLHGVGRPAIEAAHQTIFDTIYRGSTNAFTVEKCRLIGPDAMVVHIRADLNVPAGPMQGTVQTLATAVVVRSDDTWKIAAFQNTREQTPPGFKLGD